MARSPSRNALASGNFDKIIESRGGVDRKVASKIKTTLDPDANRVSLPSRSQLLRGNPPAAGTKVAIQLHKDTHLSDRQSAFVENKVDRGMSDTAAAKAAGYAAKDAPNKLRQAEKVQLAIIERQDAYKEVVQMSRKRVMDGLLEAVDMAKMKADPLSMVAGWREIAKICGYYEPTRVQVDVSVNGKMLLHQMSAMSQEDLLKLADMGDAIEGDFEEITDNE